jgi:hypothetical protein
VSWIDTPAKIGRAEITALIPPLNGDENALMIPGLDKEPVARERVFSGPGQKHEFEPEQRCLHHAIQKRRNSRTVLLNPPTVCGEIAE